MKYIRLFESEDTYKIGEYVMYINKEKVFGGEFIDKPELAQILSIYSVPEYSLYVKIIEDEDELWCSPENLRKLEPWELDAIKYNL